MEEKGLVEIKEEVQEETSMIVIKANEIAVTDKESCDLALDMGKTVNALKKEINEYFGPDIKAAHKLHKALKAKENEMIKHLDGAVEVLRGKVSAYNRELKRIQQEKEEADRKEAEIKAEVEKKRLESEAEKAAAENDEEAFEKANYEAQQVTPETQMPVHQPKEKVKGAGENWQFEVTDKRALARAVLNNTVSDEAIIPNDKFLLQFVKATKGKMPLDGVRFFDKGTIRF